MCSPERRLRIGHLNFQDHFIIHLSDPTAGLRMYIPSTQLSMRLPTRLQNTIHSRLASSTLFPFPTHKYPNPHEIFHLAQGSSQAEIKTRCKPCVSLCFRYSRISRHWSGKSASPRLHVLQGYPTARATSSIPGYISRLWSSKGKICIQTSQSSSTSLVQLQLQWPVQWRIGEEGSS